MNRTQYTELAPWIAIIVLYLVTLPILWAYALDTAIRDQLVYAGQTLPIETSIPKSEASHADPYREREVMAQITAANAAYGSMPMAAVTAMSWNWNAALAELKPCPPGRFVFAAFTAAPAAVADVFSRS